MIKELKKLIKTQEKIDLYLNNKDGEFDKEDVIETYNCIESDLQKLLKQLENCDLNKKDTLKKLLVLIELNFANLAWIVDEIRKHIRNSVIKL